MREADFFWQGALGLERARSRRRRAARLIALAIAARRIRTGRKLYDQLNPWWKKY
jgi:hypothetical protein